MRNTVLLILLAIIAAATWVASWQRQGEGPAEGPVENRGPLGYYLRGARLSGTDEQGRLIYRIRADRLDELPEEARLQMTGVSVEYLPPDETPWSISAATASSTRDGSQLDLAGNVEVQNTPGDGGALVTMLTEALRFSPDTAIAESDESVEIRVGDWHLFAMGISTQLKGDSLRLESKVHGKFAPQ